ncbi:unnamed protein product [Soboliphyme baturini]|uniref:Translocon-associated protein subunit gamma n=1 Tax=Soboliphyme baturini TaxID=241478 RepID=A0A183J1F7_9BILA|nr:unnamed protein product [Soboliphyme baturini]
MAGTKLTKEEELLLQDFSRNVSTKSSALFYGNAFVVSVVPLWLFWRIHQMEPYNSLVYWIIFTVLSTWMLAFAYRNVKFVLKHRIAQKREDAVAYEVMRKYADDRKVSKKEKDERILWKKNEVADYEAIMLSILYNNAFFLMLYVLFSFFIFHTLSINLNYILSIGGASGIVALFSTASH